MSRGETRGRFRVEEKVTDGALLIFLSPPYFVLRTVPSAGSPCVPLSCRRRPLQLQQHCEEGIVNFSTHKRPRPMARHELRFWQWRRQRASQRLSSTQQAQRAQRAQRGQGLLVCQICAVTAPHGAFQPACQGVARSRGMCRGEESLDAAAACSLSSSPTWGNCFVASLRNRLQYCKHRDASRGRPPFAE